LAGAEYLNIADSGNARQLIEQIDVAVVRQKNSVVASFREYNAINISGAVVDFLTVKP